MEFALFLLLSEKMPLAVQYKDLRQEIWGYWDRDQVKEMVE
jgi:hypothetical protein